MRTRRQASDTTDLLLQSGQTIDATDLEGWRIAVGDPDLTATTGVTALTRRANAPLPGSVLRTSPRRDGHETTRSDGRHTTV